MIRSLILSLLLCTAAFAKGPVCRVVIDHQGNLPHMDMGTGTLIQERYVLTAAHLFLDGQELTWLRFDINGKIYKALAEVVASDITPDLALLKLDRSVPVEPLAIGPLPKVGDRVRLSGYGTSPPWPGTWKSFNGKLRSITPTTDGDIYEVSFAARNGDSGGPILDAQGRIVIVLSGNFKETGLCGGGDFRPFLDKHLPKYQLTE